MHKIRDSKDIESIRQNLSPPLYHFILTRYQTLNNDTEPQCSLYCSPLPIGSLGPIWIAESESDIADREFIELIQYNIKNDILFIGTYLPTNGKECADIFIPQNILNEKMLNRLKDSLNQTITMD